MSRYQITERERDRQTDRQTDRERDRQPARQTDRHRQTDRQIHRERHRETERERVTILDLLSFAIKIHLGPKVRMKSVSIFEYSLATVSSAPYCSTCLFPHRPSLFNVFSFLSAPPCALQNGTYDRFQSVVRPSHGYLSLP